MNKDKKVAWVGIALFIGAFLFSLFFINEGLFHYDSVILARAVEDSYRTGYLHPAVGGRYGIVIINSILYFPFYLLGQNADFSTRLSSVLFYSLSIPTFFFFINILFKDRIQGFFAAVLLAVTPFYLVPNTYGKEHGMCMFFFLCSMILVNQGAERKNPGTLALASMCYIVALSVRESVLFMFPFYVWLYFKPAIKFQPFEVDIPKERLTGRLLFSFMTPLVVFFSFMMAAYLGPMIQGSLNGDEFSSPHFCGLFSSHLLFAFWELICSFPLFFFFFAIWGVVIIWHTQRYFLLLFFVFWACLIFVYGNFDGNVARYLDMMVLAVHAFGACFLAWMYRRFRVSTICVFVLMITVQLIRIYPMLEFRHHYDGSLRLAAFVKAITPPNAVLIVEDESPFIEYYGKRKTIPSPIGHWEKMDSFFHEIESLLDKQIPVYLIPTARVYLSGGTVEKSKFLELTPNGAGLLSKLIKQGALKDFSTTEVSFQLNNELKTNMIRRIAEGDYDKILAILLQARDQDSRKILDRFMFSRAGRVLFEDYHHPELGLHLEKISIYKLDYFGFNKDEFTDKMPVSRLLKTIVQDFSISMPGGHDDIEKLNNILKIKDLYKKSRNQQLPHLSLKLIKPEAEFTENEIRRRNRFFLEIEYPQQCPKFRPLAIDTLVRG